MISRPSLALVLLTGAAGMATPLAAQTVAPPAAIVVDGAPAIPQELAAATATPATRN